MKLFVKGASQSTTGKSIIFKYADRKYSGLLEVWSAYGINTAEDLEGAVIEIDENTDVKNLGGFSFISAVNIANIYKKGGFNIEDHEIEDEEDSEVFTDDVEEVEESSYEEIDFDSIYEDIPFYEIKKEARVMNPIDKMIQNAVKITKTKYDNGKANKYSFSFDLLAELGGMPFIDFIQDKISEVTIKAPKETKIPKKYINDNEKVLEYLTDKGIAQYATLSMRKEYKKKLIETEKLVFAIDKKRMDKFNKFRILAKQASLMKHETGLNPVSLAWPYLVGKTDKCTFFHAPLAYQLINIEESLNEYRLTKEPNFRINTYPILKNYSEQRSTVNEIIPEAKDIKELLIEFYKHGIKVMKPEDPKFSNYSQYKPEDSRKGKYPNSTFKLTNEVQLTLKPQDEYIYFDLKKIVVDNEEFSMPGKTFTIIEDERDIEEHRYINNVDKSKALAITKANEGSLVIYGPPGTGKSETITTLMGDLISQNKKTLFVAEKSTAIEVIRDNMKKIDLDSFVINLNNPSKLEFIAKFKKQLSLLLRTRAIRTVEPKNYSQTWNESNEELFDLSNKLKTLIDDKDITLESVVGIANFADDVSKIGSLNTFDRLINDEEVDLEVVREIYEQRNETADKKESIAKNKVLKEELAIQGEPIYKEIISNQAKQLFKINAKIANLNKTIDAETAKHDKAFKLLEDAYKSDIATIEENLNRIKTDSNKKVKSLNSQLLDTNNKKTEIEDGLIKDINNHPLNEMMYKNKHLSLLLKLKDTSEVAGIFLKKKPLLFSRYIKSNNQSLKNALMSIDEYNRSDIQLDRNIKELTEAIKQEEEDLKVTLKNVNNELTQIKTKYVDDTSSSNKVLKDFKTEREEEIEALVIEKNVLGSIPEELSELLADFDSNIIDPLADLESSNKPFIEWLESYSNAVEEIEDDENALEDINAYEIDYVLDKIKEHNVNMDTYEEDLKVFWEINENPKLLEKLGNKWDKFKTSMSKHVLEVRNAMIYGYAQNFRDKYREDEEFKSEIDRIAKFVNNKLSNRMNSVNALFMKKYEYLKEIFPVIMMNPELVSQTFDPTENIFDYAIFDEASQIRLHKAVPALHRAEIAIVAGDDKQLGPTDLFSIESDEDYDIDGGENEELNNKTLLNYAKDMYAQVQLNTHYRSKSKDLIEFSNNEFYGGKMHITDSPLARLEGNPGIIVEEVGGYWTGERTNEEEAHRVHELFKHYRVNLNKTVGIITFNDNQKNLIRDLLEGDPTLQGFMDLDDYFLKSIKDVQGDERDVVIFSITYGKRKTSEAYVKNFGYFSKEKINVAITRSKLRMHVLKSIPSSEINESNDDYIVFKRWLKYIETKRDESQNFDDYDFNNFRSDFERDYYKTISGLLPDTIIALPNYQVAGKEIDLVLYDKETNRFIGAIELDGSKWHGSAEQKADDFERQTYLEAMGWQFVRTTFWEFYRNRRARVERDFRTLLEISKDN